MENQLPKARDEEEERLTDDGGTADASVMTEGVGGMPDLEPDARATVSDVDGDNVEEDGQLLRPG